MSLMGGGKDGLTPFLHSRHRILSRNGHVYRQNSPMQSLFVVRSGSVKAYRLSEEGDELVLGDYLPGEVLGMDGCANDAHQFSTVALETTSVCEIPYGRFMAMASHAPELQKRVMALFGAELERSQRLLMLINKHTAEQRIAAWLLQYSSRLTRLRRSHRSFQLNLLRSDIGNLLGLTLETVSRVLTRIHRAGIIKLNGRAVELNDIDALQQLAVGERMPESKLACVGHA
ncbi:MAG: helix-turn-helix domain-containing protein [Gammaproteobacteria bacterium]|nr:helix-turn-helix domain-containing protein [Gammaproteobacteria bacterium]